MKKFFVLLVSIAASLTVLVSCGNMQLLDTTYTFNYAIIQMPDGSVVEGDVQYWRDFEDADQLQIVIDGATYLVHSANAVLVNR